MGPQLLFDKSALQALSQAEARTTATHYYLVYAPILFAEILGDLKKFPSAEDQKREVSKVASKMPGGESCFTAHYGILLEANLLGHHIQMDGRPVLLGGIDVRDSLGRRGTFFEEQPERDALRRWLAGKMSEAEALLSNRWRESTREFSLEKLRSSTLRNSVIRTFESLMVSVESLCNDPCRRLENLQWIITEGGIGEKAGINIFNRWLALGMPSLKDFAPFAYYCLRVFAAFYLGIANDLVGTRSTNRLDLEYILYLPFCKVFCSGDRRFHSKLAPLFLEPDQDFVDAQVLKNDLSRIHNHFASLTTEDRKSYREKFGLYPPDWDDSFTNSVWKKHMKPRSEYKRLTLDADGEEKLMEHIRPMMEAIKAARRPRDDA
jgi:hypothetical protein